MTRCHICDRQWDGEPVCHCGVIGSSKDQDWLEWYEKYKTLLKYVYLIYVGDAIPTEALEAVDEPMQVPDWVWEDDDDIAKVDFSYLASDVD